jgi:hypothetical protein
MEIAISPHGKPYSSTLLAIIGLLRWSNCRFKGWGSLSQMTALCGGHTLITSAPHNYLWLTSHIHLRLTLQSRITAPKRRPHLHCLHLRLEPCHCKIAPPRQKGSLSHITCIQGSNLAIAKSLYGAKKAASPTSLASTARTLPLQNRITAPKGRQL